jgi:hypothetical protein
MMTEAQLQMIEAEYPDQDYYEENDEAVHDDIRALIVEIRRLNAAYAAVKAAFEERTQGLKALCIGAR